MGSSKIVFTEGKEKALQILFSQNNFGFLALGYSNEPNMFQNKDTESGDLNNGFYELTNQDYRRIPITNSTKSSIDKDAGIARITIYAELPTDNIKEPTPINQYAICDSANKDDANTTFYAASTFPRFEKNDKIAINFEIDLKLQ